jgi:transposase
MLLADRGYDADWIRELAMKKGAWATSRRKAIATIDLLQPLIYRARNRIERFFNRIKQCRRVATRYDKLAATTLPSSSLHPSGYGWLRVNESTH